MKLRAITSIYKNGALVDPGTVLDIEDKDEAERLIQLGAAEEASSPQPQSSTENSTTQASTSDNSVKVETLALDDEIKAKLIAAGFVEAKDLLESTVDDIVALAGITEKQAKQAIKAAK